MKWLWTQIQKVTPLRWLVGLVLLLLLAVWVLLKRLNAADERARVEMQIGREREKLRALTLDSARVNREEKAYFQRKHDERVAVLDEKKAAIDKAAAEGGQALTDLLNATFHPGVTDAKD